MLFRFLAIALCATCVVLLASFRPVRIMVIPPAVAPPPASAPCRFDPGPPALSVVDVAPGVAPSRLVELIHLGWYEHIAAVNDRALDEHLPAGPQIAQLAPRPGGFLDLTVASSSSQRRVLVLLHGSPPRAPGAAIGMPIGASIESAASGVTRRPYRSGFAP